jgi:O-antigen/teichoic acid export membrane protein
VTVAPEHAEERRHLARGVAVSALGILVKSGRAVALVVFSRQLGVELFGVYLLAFVVQEVASKFASLGFDRGLLFLTGILQANGREREIRGAVGRVAAVGFAASAVAAALFAAASGWIAGSLLHKPELAEPLRLFALGMPAVCAGSMLVFATRTSLDLRPELYVQSLFEPWALLAFGGAAAASGFGVRGIVLVQVAVSYASLALAWIFVRRLYPAAAPGTRVRVDWRTLWRASLPLGAGELLTQFKLRLDLMVIGRLLPMQLVGVYGAVVEIASILRKTRSAFDAILMPLSQRLHLQGASERLRESLALAVRWVAVPALAILGLMFLVPDGLLRLFGKDFLAGEAALGVFAVGQLFHVTIGLMESVLAYTGHAGVTLVNSVVLVVVNLALLVLLIPPWGILGAAAATTVSTAAVALWRLAQGRRLLGIWPFDAAQLQPVAGFLLGYPASWILLHALGRRSAPALVAAAALFLAVYGATLALLGRRARRSTAPGRPC